MMTKQILIDSNFLYAVYNQEDSLHERAVNFVQQSKDRPLVPDVILPEVCYLFRRDFGHHRIADFLKAFAASGTSLIGIETTDVDRAAAIMVAYPTARRDFSIIVPSHGEFLNLLP